MNRINRIKNNVIVPLKSQIIAYNAIGDVCRILGDTCLQLSSVMDRMTNGGNVTFGRRMRYYAAKMELTYLFLSWDCLAT